MIKRTSITESALVPVECAPPRAQSAPVKSAKCTTSS